MTSRLHAVAYDARDPQQVAAFWATLLRREVVEDADGLLVPGPGAEVELRFVRSGSEQVGRGRMHLHLTSSSTEDQRRTVAVALGAGATHLDVGQLPEEGHIVLADPQGNELCVIEPGNAYLAGCGLLAEVACDGLREVGVFWSEVLDWPLVWDQDGETAVQSPVGGTKVAWGGPPLEPKHGRSRQRLDLLTDDDLEAEADRLVRLGATRVRTLEDGTLELADPGGDELWLGRSAGRVGRTGGARGGS